MVYQSSSSENTKKFGAILAAKILNHGVAEKHATILALEGDLGAGKTTFTQGFFKGLGIKRAPNSPTFILMRRIAMPRKKSDASGFKNIYHVDAYRIREAKDMKSLGFEDLLTDPQNLFLIEWPVNIASILPKKKMVIKFSHGKTPESRSITIKVISR